MGVTKNINNYKVKKNTDKSGVLRRWGVKTKIYVHP
ncbi:uncharacterized protein G2W53_014090 [Senna tora]|uniref:Uncharacterized protein n=1 Tax=Senna tora TaxID=362788 RepID=A0A834WR74_9FABA|nr:uncharacterized protein G2W53_014090 [Senna tora]